MGAVEGVRHLPGEPDRFLDRKLTLAPEPVAQALAFDVRHRVPEEPARRAGVEDREDVRVIEPGGQVDLAEEALGTQGSGELRMEQLQGDPPVMLEVLGEVDRGHAAAPELALEHVALTEGSNKARGEVHRQRSSGSKSVVIQTSLLNCHTAQASRLAFRAIDNSHGRQPFGAVAQR